MSKEERFVSMTEYGIKMIQKCTERAKFYKKIYDKTENRGGIFKLVNRFAKRKNAKYCYLGMSVVDMQLRLISEDMMKNLKRN